MSAADPISDSIPDAISAPAAAPAGGVGEGPPARAASAAQFAEWSDSFRVGVDDIDEQHRTLFALINQLAQAVFDASQARPLDPVFRQLEDYTLKHFRDEEMLMAAAGYPGLAAHRASHVRFAQVVAEAKAKHADGMLPGLDTLLFFNAWLVEHIQREDQVAADFYLGRLPPRSWFERIFRRSADRSVRR